MYPTERPLSSTDSWAPRPPSRASVTGPPQHPMRSQQSGLCTKLGISHFSEGPGCSQQRTVSRHAALGPRWTELGGTQAPCLFLCGLCRLKPRGTANTPTSGSSTFPGTLRCGSRQPASHCRCPSCADTLLTCWSSDPPTPAQSTSPCNRLLHGHTLGLRHPRLGPSPPPVLDPSSTGPTGLCRARHL